MRSTMDSAGSFAYELLEDSLIAAEQDDRPKDGFHAGVSASCASGV